VAGCPCSLRYVSGRQHSGCAPRCARSTSCTDSLLKGTGSRIPESSGGTFSALSYPPPLSPLTRLLRALRATVLGTCPYSGNQSPEPLALHACRLTCPTAVGSAPARSHAWPAACLPDGATSRQAQRSTAPAGLPSSLSTPEGVAASRTVRPFSQKAEAVRRPVPWIRCPRAYRPEPGFGTSRAGPDAALRTIGFHGLAPRACCPMAACSAPSSAHQSRVAGSHVSGVRTLARQTTLAFSL